MRGSAREVEEVERLQEGESVLEEYGLSWRNYSALNRSCLLRWAGRSHACLAWIGRMDDETVKRRARVDVCRR